MILLKSILKKESNNEGECDVDEDEFGGLSLDELYDLKNSIIAEFPLIDKKIDEYNEKISYNIRAKSKLKICLFSFLVMFTFGVIIVSIFPGMYKKDLEYVKSDEYKNRPDNERYHEKWEKEKNFDDSYSYNRVRKLIIKIMNL